MVIIVNFIFGQAESEVSFHQTLAESQAATMVGVSQGFWHMSLCKSDKVDVVVDTISRQAYYHNLLSQQEQPLSMRILCDLF